MTTNIFTKFFLTLLILVTSFLCSFGADIDLSRTTFYVKETGSGSGTDWTDAMSGEDFAAILPKVKNGTTFHVAAGTYQPNSKVDTRFKINSSVTIIGGYSRSVKSLTAQPNPQRNVTTFTGDLDGEDITTLFEINRDNVSLTFSGVTVSDASNCGIMNLNSTECDVVLKDCKIKNCGYGVNSAPNINLDIQGCSFLNNRSPIYISLIDPENGRGYTGSVKIKDTKFEDNEDGFVICCRDCDFDNVDYSNNSDNIIIRYYGAISIKNSRFEKNSIINRVLIPYELIEFDGFDENTEVLLENCRFNYNNCSSLFVYDRVKQNIQIKNCSFSDNVLESGLFSVNKVTLDLDETTASIEGSSFVRNKSSKDLILFYSNLVLKNNMFAENNANLCLIRSNQKPLVMENNTILDRSSNSVLYASSSPKIIGNIILPSNSKSSAITIDDGLVSLENNLISNGVYLQGTNIQYSKYKGNINLSDEKSINETLATLFEGEVTSSGFEPKITLNKDDFPTLNLISDVLPDGETSIRFPLASTSLTTDQFGVERSSSTCMGSLELCTDEIDVVWSPITYNPCSSTSLGKYVIHYQIKDNESSPSSPFYGVVKNEKGETFKSSICTNRVRSGYITFSDLPVGKYSNMKFFVESGLCKEIFFHDDDALIPTFFEIVSTNSLATLDLVSTSDAKCSDKGSAVFSLNNTDVLTSFEVVDDKGNKVGEFEAKPSSSLGNKTPGSISIGARFETKGIENLKAGIYHVRYAGCDGDVLTFEIKSGASFTATAKLLEICKSSPGRVVLEIYDSNGNPAKGTFSFVNPEYPESALEDKDGNPNNSDPKDNVRMFSEGKYLIQSAGRPVDVILVSDGTCEIEVPTVSYTATEDDLKIKVEGATPKFCAGDETGSIEFSYSGFNGGDYYDVALSCQGVNRPVDFLYGHENSFVIDNLEPGEYRITANITTGYIGCNISDGNIFDEVITIKEPVAMSVTPKTPVASSCGESNGSVEIEITGWNASSDNGWKFYKDADASTSATIPFSKTVTNNANGTVSVKQSALASGDYIFELKDNCGKVSKKTITIPGGASKPLTVTEKIEGYSCPEKADGKITYNVTNWNSSCSATFDRNVKTPTSVSAGVAEFVFTGLSKDTYGFYVIDGCGESQLITSDLKAAGTEMTFRRFATSGSTSNKCDIADRKIQIAVTGGKTTSYTLDLKDESGKSVETSKFTSSYTTSPLPNGTYSAVITNSDESCTITSSAVTLSSNFTVELTAYRFNYCPNSTGQLRLVADVKAVGTNKVGSDISFSAVDQDGVETEIPSTNIRPLGNGKYVLIHIPSTTSHILTNDGNCTYISYINDAVKGTTTTEFSSAITSKNATCYATNNSEISLTFSKMSAVYDMNFTLTPYGGTKSNLTSYKESGTLTHDNLAAGTYKVEAWVAIENCNIVLLETDNITIESPASNPLISIVSSSATKCGDDGAVSLKVTGLYKNATHQYAFYAKGTASPAYSALTPDAENTFSFSEKNLAAGTYVFAVKDGCGKTFTKEVEIADEGRDAITVSAGTVVGYSCPEAKDGSAVYTVSNWSNACAATWDGVAAEPTVSAGVATFNFAKLGNKSYVFEVSNGCGDPIQRTADLTKDALSLQRFMVPTTYTDCDVTSHTLQIGVSGGKTNAYTYNLVNEDGVAFDTKAYTTNPYPDGIYKLTVSIPNCSVSSQTVTIKSKFTASLAKLDLGECETETQRVVVTLTPSTGYTLRKVMSFTVGDASNKESEVAAANVIRISDTKYQLAGMSKSAKYLIISDGSCSAVAYFSNMGVEELSLPATMSAKITTTPQTCYSTSNATVTLTYSNISTLYGFVYDLNPSTLTDTYSEKKFADASGTYKYENVAADKYTARAWVSIEGCDVKELTKETFTIEAPASNPLISIVSSSATKCGDDGAVSLKVTGLYKNATHQYAFYAKGTASPAYSALTPDAENTFLFSEKNLAAGTYVFAVKDGCGKTFTKEVEIADEALSPIKILDPVVKGYSCKEAADGSFTISVSNWDNECSAVLNDDEKEPESVEDGLARFKFTNLNMSSYEFKVINACGGDLKKTIALDADELKIDEFTIWGSEKTCDDDNKKLFVTVSGGNTKTYNYEFFDSKGELIYKATDKTDKFHTDRLLGGTYTVKVSAGDVCSVTSDEFDIIPTYSISLSKLDMPDCNVETQRVVVEIVTESNYEIGDRMVFYYVTPEQKFVETTSTSRPLGNNKYLLTGIPTSAVAISTIDNNCSTNANLSDAAILSVDVPSVKMDIESENQTCYKIKNGSISLKYSDMDVLYDLMFTLEQNGKIVKTETVSEKSGIVTFEDINAGSYKAKAIITAEGCELSEMKNTSVVVESPAENFKVSLIDKTKNNCVSVVDENKKPIYNGSVKLGLEGWYPRYKWAMFKGAKGDEPENLVYSSAVKDEDGIATIEMQNIDGGDYVLRVVDDCETIEDYEFSIETEQYKSFTFGGDAPIAYTCIEASNGEQTFNIGNWNKDDKAVLKWTTEEGEVYEKICVPQFKNGGSLAVFTFKNLRDYKYYFEITGICNRKLEKEFSLKEYSESNRALGLVLQFDEDDAKCDIEKRRVVAKAVGTNNGDYTFEVFDEDGNLIAKNVQTSPTFTSDILPLGTYSVKVTTKEVCSKESEKFTIGSSFEPLVYVIENSCDGENVTGNRLLVSIPGSDGTDDVSFSSLNANNVATVLKIEKFIDDRYLLKNVPLNTDILLVTKGSCSEQVPMSEARLFKSSLPATANVEDLKVYNCFGETVKSWVELDYSGFNGYYDLVCRLEHEDGIVTFPKQITTNESGKFEFDKLPAGFYTIFVDVELEGCKLTNKPVYKETFEIKEIGKPFDIVSIDSVKNNCEEENFNGSAKIVIEGTYAPNYKWSLSKSHLDTKWNYGDNDIENEDGTITINVNNLSDGKYLFNMLDVCGNNKQKSFYIGKDYIPKATVFKIDEKPFSCPEAKNGAIRFRVGNWDERDTATFDGVKYPEFVKTASETGFEFLGLGAESHVFRIADVCKRSFELPFDFGKVSSGKEFRIESVDFDAEAASCNKDKRILSAKLAGGYTDNYTFTLKSDDGTIIDEGDNLVDGKYTSPYLPDGHLFTFEVKSDEGCTATYQTSETIKSMDNVKAYYQSKKCISNVYQTLFVVESENVISDASVYAMSKNKKSHLLGEMDGTTFTVTNVIIVDHVLKFDSDAEFEYIRIVKDQDGCEILVPLEDYVESTSPFEGVEIPVSSTSQKCFDTNDGSILVDLKNIDTKYNILLTVENVDTKEKFNGKRFENTTIRLVDNLAPGEYKVSLSLYLGTCSLDVTYDLENQIIKKLDKLVVEKLPLHHTRCANDFVDTAIVKLTGWEDGLYHWIYKLENSKLSDDNVEFYEAAIAPDNHIAVFPRHPGQASITFYDGCENVVEKAVFDIPAPDVDFKIDDDIFNPKKAACDVSYRSLKLDLSGSLDDNIKYTLTSGNEIIDEGETIAGGKYVSPMLPNGKLFHFEAVTPQGCKVTYDTEEELYSLVPYDAFKTEVTCGGEKSTMILVKHENPLWDAWIYLLESDGSWTSLEPYMLNGKFKTTVKNKSDESYHYIKVLHNECETLVELDEYVEDGDPLSNIEPEIIPIPQSCYGVSNGHITAKYESVDSEYDVIFSATSVEDENYVVYGKDILPYFCVIDSLPVGKYNVKMHLSVGGCPLEGKFKDLGDFEVINLVTKPLVIKEHKLTQSDCFTDVNFKPNVVFYFENFITDLYHWQYSVGDVKSGVFHHDLNNTIYIEPPTDGHLVFTVKDNCADSHPDDHIWTVEDDVIRQKVPTISVKEDRAAGVCPGNGTSLLVEFDNALKGKGRIYAECNSADNANFMEELPAIPDLPKSGKLRIYDFQYGKYGEAYSYTYDLNENVERKLIPAIYTVGYQNTDEKCAGEVVFKRDTIRYPIRLKMAVRDVLCESTNEASVCFVPQRPYSSNVNYTLHSDKDSDRGSNWVELLGKSASEQRAMFEKKFVLGHVLDEDHPFRSNVFEDIKEIRIEPTSKYIQNKEALYEAINNVEGRMKYPLPEFRLGTDIDRVVTDYFGLRLLPTGEYVITTTDMEGCSYKDTFEVKGPKFPLAIYDPHYDDNGYCDADKRRISFKAVGGWTRDDAESSYDFFLLESGKNIEEFEGQDNPNGTGSLVLDNDYVGMSRKEALPPVTATIKTTVGSVVKDVEYKNAHSEMFTSPILSPGTYNLVVMDALGCMATLDAKIEVKAKYILDGKPVIDKCDPLHDNRLYPKVLKGDQNVTANVSSYNLRIGHATECVSYPFGCFALGHVHECYPDENHPERAEYPNCVSIESSIDKHPVKTNSKEKDGTSGIAITSIPRGKIGVYAVMSDGCSAFNEFEYYTKGKQKLTLTNLETFAANCNGAEDENGGFLHFQLFGGNDKYSSITLDGKNISPNGLYAFKSYPETVIDNGIQKDVTKVEMVDNQGITLKDLYKSGLSVEEVVRGNNTSFFAGTLLSPTWFETINYRFTPIEDLDGVVDEDGNINYDYLETKYKNFKNSYSFVLPKVSGTTEYSYDDNGKSVKSQGKPHVLKVVDNEECEATLEFFIDQPEKLEIFPDASMPCPDGVGRIITSNTRGGIAPYRWSVEKFETEEINKIFSIDKPQDQLPKDLNGNLLNKLTFLYYYQDNPLSIINGVPVERIPANVYKEHKVFVYDANNCKADGIQKPYSGAGGSWDNVKTDYLVGRYHNYGDVLVLTDNSYYDNGMTFNDNNPGADKVVKGFDAPFYYDSMRVDIRFNTEGMSAANKEIVENLIIERKPSSLFVYGVKEGNTVEFDGKSYQGPIWGIPSEIASSVIPDDKYDEYSGQLAAAESVLDNYAEVVAKSTICRMINDKKDDKKCDYYATRILLNTILEEDKEILKEYIEENIENALKLVRIALTPSNYIGEIDKETGERKDYSIERIEKKAYEFMEEVTTQEFWSNYKIYALNNSLDESMKRYFNSEREYESVKGKIDGHYKLSQITSAFDILVDQNEEETQKRMAFIKFTKSDKEKNILENNIKNEVDKFFDELVDKRIPFDIKVTTFISGCDLTTELNGLYVLNQDTLPYDSPNYKATIELVATPNPAINGTTKVSIITNKPISITNPLTYSIYSVEGKNSELGENVPFYGTNGKPYDIVKDNGDKIREYEYSIDLNGLNDYNGYVFVAKFGNRTESIKILTK